MLTHFDLLRPPDSITVYNGTQPVPLQPHGEQWAAGDIFVETQSAPEALAISVAAETSLLERIHLRWEMPVPAGLRFLGDAWERAYGDLEWRGIFPERVMPWYFLVYDGEQTCGYGVKTQPGALCFWMVDSAGVNLWLDVRCGGVGVDLRGRTLAAARVVTRAGQPGESPFAAARAFCHQLCDSPRVPAQPVYGSNDWYYSYGTSSQEHILNDAAQLVALSPQVANRPFMVIDAGWQPLSGDSDPIQAIVGGPYSGSNIRFPNMPDLAARIREIGAQPGI